MQKWLPSRVQVFVFVTKSTVSCLNQRTLVLIRNIRHGNRGQEQRVVVICDNFSEHSEHDGMEFVPFL